MRTYLETGAPDRFFTLPKRGIRVMAPLASRRILEDLRENGKNGHSIWSPEEKARIKLLRDCRILARRYPNPQSGKDFMNHVSIDRREHLYRMAQDLTSHVVEQWHEIKPDKPIAVILFGSIAKGLVKNTNHPDPSNIDLAVLGNFSDSERSILMDKIKPKRLQIGEEIKKDCARIVSPEKSPGNAGVFVQNIYKVKNGSYGCALNYISSGAIALYDPAGIWEKIEQEALSFYARKQNKKTKR